LVEGLFFRQFTKIRAPAVKSGLYLKVSSKLISAYAGFFAPLFPGNFIFLRKLLALRLSSFGSEQFSQWQWSFPVQGPALLYLAPDKSPGCLAAA
jgi:hypothetical protein